VISLALLIVSLIERQVRQALDALGETTIDGLYAGRPAVPTTRLILQALATMRLIAATSDHPPIIPAPTPPPTRLLELFDIDPRQWC
jgi:hypothetical protein